MAVEGIRLSAQTQRTMLEIASGQASASEVKQALIAQYKQKASVVEFTATFSAEESRKFLHALDEPFQPNARLQRALAQVFQYSSSATADS